MSICCYFKTWAVSFTPLCLCLSEETLKAVGPFYLVSMPGEEKDPTQGVNVNRGCVVRQFFISVQCVWLAVDRFMEKY